MTIGNGAKKEANGILTKERPRFCKETNFRLPIIRPSSSQFHDVDLSGVKRSMVLVLSRKLYHVQSLVSLELIATKMAN